MANAMIWGVPKPASGVPTGCAASVSSFRSGACAAFQCRAPALQLVPPDRSGGTDQTGPLSLAQSLDGGRSAAGAHQARLNSKARIGGRSASSRIWPQRIAHMQILGNLSGQRAISSGVEAVQRT